MQTVTQNLDAVRERVERVLLRHQPQLQLVGRPTCCYCAEIWPCPSALAAQQAVVQAGGPPPGLPVAPHPRSGEDPV